MTKYQIVEYEIGEMAEIGDRDILVGVIEKSGSTYVVVLKIMVGVR